MSSIDAPVARAVVNEAALARNREALLAAAAAMPAAGAFAYERHRAQAYAHALSEAHDDALAELSLAAAAGPPSTVLAGDSAQLHLLLGDPARAIAGLAAAARADLALDPHAKDVLLAAVRTAPGEWRPALAASLWARRPNAAFVVVGTAFDSVGNGVLYRAAIAGAALATVVLAFVTLPGTLFDDEERSAGVTLPRTAVPPDVVTVDVPEPVEPARDTPVGRPSSSGRASFGIPDATLIRAVVRPSPSSGGIATPKPPGRPRPPRPSASGQGTPAPSPRPLPGPTPSPASPSEPTGVVTSAPSSNGGGSGPRPAPPKQPPTQHGKSNAPGQQKKKDKEKPAPATPTPVAPTAVAEQSESASPAPEHGNGNAEKEKDKEKGGPKK